MRLSAFFCSVLSALAVAQSAAGQQAAPAQPPVSTLKAQARLVIVDVVVTDRDHHAVQGLARQDFTVLEGGQPQTVAAFEEHRALSAGEAAKFPVLPPMPPGVFTNYTPAPSNTAVNILLLDALNTPMKDQAYVRQQLLEYLKNSRPGTNVAIFGLSTQLVMLQGFTQNPELLKAVVNKQMGKGSPLLDDVVGGGGMPDTATDQNAAMGNLLPADIVAHMQTFQNMTTSFQLQLRAKYTLDAMSVLARYLSSVPGRKNLIWFSGSFPINIMPDMTGESDDPFAGVADSEKEYRDTTNLLAFSQVAVYPIDARGLMTSPVFSAAISGAKYAHHPSAVDRDSNTFFQQTADEHSTMYRMADDTGGRAFVNTNGLSQAVATAIDEGSSYYTIAYVPTNAKWTGAYRRIKVTLAKPNYLLAYRHGYYADDPNGRNSAVALAPAAAADKPPNLAAQGDAKAGANSDNAAAIAGRDAMMKAMIHGVPGATQILYKVRILPRSNATEDTVAQRNGANSPNYAAMKPPYKRYALDFAVSPADISFTVSAEGTRRGMVDFMVVVYQPDGRRVNSAIETVEATLTPAQYRSLGQSGIPMHLEVSVPVKGDYSIRTGIFDHSSNRVGASEVSIAAVKNLPPIVAPVAQAPGK